MGSDGRLNRAFSRPRGLVLGALVAVVMLALPALAFAHLERPSYWPDPAPDTSVSPPPAARCRTPARSQSAVSGAGPGRRARRLQGQ